MRLCLQFEHLSIFFCCLPMYLLQIVNNIFNLGYNVGFVYQPEIFQVLLTWREPKLSGVFEIKLFQRIIIKNTF